MRPLQCRESDPRLLPDLSAAVDVELERRPDVLLAPRDALMMDNGKTYVWVKHGMSFEKRLVTLGLRNDRGGRGALRPGRGRRGKNESVIAKDKSKSKGKVQNAKVKMFDLRIAPARECGAGLALLHFAFCTLPFDLQWVRLFGN